MLCYEKEILTLKKKEVKDVHLMLFILRTNEE